MTYQEGSGDLATSNKTTNTMKFLVKVLMLRKRVITEYM